MQDKQDGGRGADLVRFPNCHSSSKWVGLGGLGSDLVNGVPCVLWQATLQKLVSLPKRNEKEGGSVFAQSVILFKLETVQMNFWGNMFKAETVEFV